MYIYNPSSSCKSFHSPAGLRYRVCAAVREHEHTGQSDKKSINVCEIVCISVSVCRQKRRRSEIKRNAKISSHINSSYNSQEKRTFELAGERSATASATTAAERKVCGVKRYRTTIHGLKQGQKKQKLHDASDSTMNAELISFWLVFLRQFNAYFDVYAEIVNAWPSFVAEIPHSAPSFSCCHIATLIVIAYIRLGKLVTSERFSSHVTYGIFRYHVWFQCPHLSGSVYLLTSTGLLRAYSLIYSHPWRSINNNW